MAVVTTGSAVNGLVPGLTNHFAGTTAVLKLFDADPDGIITPVAATATASGGTVAYDVTNNQYYKCDAGSTWYKLGSVA